LFLYSLVAERLAGVIAAIGAETEAIDAGMAEICRNSKQLVETIERKMFGACRSSDTFARQMELLTSIPGVGKVVALAMIIETGAFTKFDNPRRFCTHAGVAPFAWDYGTSVHSGNKVSHRANKDMKRLLHMAAVSVLTQKNGELREYYDRKVSDGKNKMLVLNAIRAKLVARMFVVIKHDTPV
jgi:transposase